LALSADEKNLYVADGNTDREGRPNSGPTSECRWACRPIQVLHAFAAGQRGIEGMCLDDTGKIIAVADGSRTVLARWSMYLPHRSGPGNESGTGRSTDALCFGDEGLTSLYLTHGEGHLYRAKEHEAIAALGDRSFGVIMPAIVSLEDLRQPRKTYGSKEFGPVEKPHLRSGERSVEEYL